MSIGVGIGIVVANLFVAAQLLDSEVAYPAMIFLSAGAGLVASHYLASSKKDKK